MKRKSFLYIIISQFTLLIISSSTFAYNSSSWMQDIDDNTYLGQLAIPGTHDSGAYEISTDIGETQDWSISQQLNNGIRFLDIRIANNSSQNDFEVRHGILELGSFNKNVMEPVINFLSSHPHETIFMSIKDEDTLDILRLKRSYIHKNGSKFYHNSVEPRTQLKDVRGKIVLFDRFKGNDGTGIRWNSGSLKIQDEYELQLQGSIPILNISIPVINSIDYARKAQSVVEHLDKAINHYSSSNFWINFTSANYKGLYIGNSAKYVNSEVKEYLVRNSIMPIGSIIIMDYPNRVSGLIDLIIRNSLKYHSREKKVVTETIIPSGALNSKPTDGHFGSWGGIAKCPDNQFVYGYRLRSEEGVEDNDDTALNAIELRCASKGSTNYTTIHSKSASWGNFGGYAYCSDANNPVTGFKIKIESKQGSKDDTAANDIDLYCKDGSYISAPQKTDWGSWSGEYKCPNTQVVIGIKTRVEKDQGSGDDTALNGVRLLCGDYDQ